MTSLSRVIDMSHKETMILPEFRRLSSDPSFRVRQQCAENLGKLSQTLGVDLSQHELVRQTAVGITHEYPEERTCV